MNSGERHSALLKHLARYRIGIREVLLRLFFTGAEAQLSNTLQALRRKGLVAFRTRGLSGGHTYYQLTEKAYLELGFSEHAAKERAHAPSGQPLHKALATLWFSTAPGTERKLLEDGRVFEICPPAPPGQDPHVLERTSSGDARLYRLYIPGTRAGASYTLKNLREDAEKLAAHPDGPSLLVSEFFVFAILVHNAARRGQFEESLKRVPLPSAARVLVELAPSPDSLPLFLSPAKES